MTSQSTTAVPGKPADVVGKLDLTSSIDVLLIDETKCIRCNNCVDACAATHQGQPRLNRAAGPSLARVHVPVACRHCEGTPCLQDCPVDAIMRDADGVVQIDAKTCIGCGNCSQCCPFQAIFMVEPPQPKSSWSNFTHIVDFLRPTQVAVAHNVGHRTIAVKCDLCFDIDGGPACVRNCPTGAAVRVQGADVPATVVQMATQA
jgi:Fe-S-cluster-containing hydrogenase component 2